MSDSQEEKLEEMLQSRRVEPASPELKERIILKAQRLPQNPTFTLAEWVKRLCAEFHVPRPAYVLALTLLLGFIVGLYTSSDTRTVDGEAVDVQSFLYADEGPL